MTTTQSRTFAILIEGFHSGEIGENEFIEVGLDAGIPAERLNDVLNAMRKEDGVCQ